MNEKGNSFKNRFGKYARFPQRRFRAAIKNGGEKEKGRKEANFFVIRKRKRKKGGESDAGPDLVYANSSRKRKKGKSVSNLPYMRCANTNTKVHLFRRREKQTYGRTSAVKRSLSLFERTKPKNRRNARFVSQIMLCYRSSSSSSSAGVFYVFLCVR